MTRRLGDCGPPKKNNWNCSKSCSMSPVYYLQKFESSHPKQPSIVLVDWPFCLLSECIAHFIVYACRKSVTNIWQLILYGRSEVASDSETLGTKTCCLLLITSFVILQFANYSKYKAFNFKICGPFIVIYLRNKHQQDINFLSNYFNNHPVHFNILLTVHINIFIY